MKAFLILIGKTDDDYIKEGIEKYAKRIQKYHPFEIIILPDVKKSKKMTEEVQKQKEGELLVKHLKKYEKVILLDENGKRFSSLKFAQHYESFMLSGIRNVAFVIGGPYGFSKEIYQQFPETLSLSSMTFSHQLVRLLFLEQLYRINTIIRKEPYHHI